MSEEKIYNVPLTAAQIQLVKEFAEFHVRHAEELDVEVVTLGEYSDLVAKLETALITPTVKYLIFDWTYTDPRTGKETYARTPEKAAELAKKGIYLTQVYTRHVDFPKG